MIRETVGAALLLATTGASAAADRRGDDWPRATEAAMTDAERVVLTSSMMPLPDGPLGDRIPEGAVKGAGYVAPIPRLGIPALTISDASLGVSWALGARGSQGATPLPSGTAMAATWNAVLVRRAGAMIGAEARAKGFNVLLAGGINLIRDPRGGRSFEYLSEDPLLSGVLGGEAIAGVQSNAIMSTVKHFAFNNQETGRHFANVRISEAAARESELLAFQIAIERGKPGAVMCAYNRVNGPYACGSDWLLNTVLKQDWKYPGFVMSDWNAVHSVEYAMHGLDQQSAGELDAQRYFQTPLQQAAARDPAYRARLANMNRRVLYAIDATGLRSRPVRPGGSIDKAANAAIAEEVERQAIVLLRNRGHVLPLASKVASIAVIGGYADVGVLSGGGSSQVHVDGGPAAALPGGGKGLFNGYEQYQRVTPPLAAIRSRAGEKVSVTFRTGAYVGQAVAAARKADVAIVFANQWQTEGFDQPDLSLPRGQDALIDAVAAANPNTIVVLQTGSAVAMPWLDRTAAVIEAWYPGARGGEAIAAVLFGDVNPSGRLPVTFPADTAQLARPLIDGSDTLEPLDAGKPQPGKSMTIDYSVDGADVGYRWFARMGHKPLFPFGFGLSYTGFSTSRPVVRNETAEVTVRNTGSRSGATVVQLYLIRRAGVPMRRLIGFQRVDLKPDEQRRVVVPLDRRVMADWRQGAWHLPAGRYEIAAGDNAEALGDRYTLDLPARSWSVGH